MPIYGGGGTWQERGGGLYPNAYYEKVTKQQQQKAKTRRFRLVVMEEGKVEWRLGKVLGLIKGHDNQVRGAHKKVAKTNTVVQSPVTRLYKIEGKEDNINSDILNKGNVNKDSDHSENTSNRPKRGATIIGEVKRKYTSNAK